MPFRAKLEELLMKNRNLIRILAIVLALACLIGTAAAAGADLINLHLNDDEVINIWDAQKALFGDYTEGQRKSFAKLIADKVLGRGYTPLQTNDANIYQIDSASDLYQMAALSQAELTGKTFRLTADIDLGGAEWVPIQEFPATFLGGDANKSYTISNFTIKRSVQLTNDDYVQAFFARLNATGVIDYLNLSDFTIEADANAEFIAPIAGSISDGGHLTNCTVSNGTIQDTRSASSALAQAAGTQTGAIYYGALAGRIVSAATDVSVTGADTLTLTVTTESGTEYITEGLSSTVKMAIANPANVGLVGYHNPKQTYTLSGQWLDTSNSSLGQSQILQTRRGTVVDYMRDMATVKWMVQDEDLEYFKNYLNSNDAASTNYANTHYQRYEPGIVFQGIPYAHAAGSLSRFASRGIKNNDIITMNSGLKDGYYFSGDFATSLITQYKEDPSILAHITDIDDPNFKSMDHFGFVRYIGNDCSSAVSWAWRQVAAVSVADGGSFGDGAADMLATSNNISKFGLQAINDFTVSQSWNTDCDISNSTTYNNYIEAFAHAKRGDVLSGESHSRLLSEDPVVIRNASGGIVADKSYFITIEQGDGFYDSKSNSQIKTEIINVLDGGSTPAAGALGSIENPINYSWRIDYQYTFANLLNYKTSTSTATVGTGNYYVPVSIPALNQDSGELYNPETGTAVVPRVTLGEIGANKLWSNFYITSIKKGDTELFTDVYQHRGNESPNEDFYRPDHTAGMDVTLDTDYAALGLAEGDTFYVQVSNGDWYQLTYSATGTSSGTKVN